jgi:hypothetical protein
VETSKRFNPKNAGIVIEQNKTEKIDGGKND